MTLSTSSTSIGIDDLELAEINERVERWLDSEYAAACAALPDVVIDRAQFDREYLRLQDAGHRALALERDADDYELYGTVVSEYGPYACALRAEAMRIRASLPKEGALLAAARHAAVRIPHRLPAKMSTPLRRRPAVLRSPARNRAPRRQHRSRAPSASAGSDPDPPSTQPAGRRSDSVGGHR